MARGEELVLRVVAALPNGADRMDDVAGGQLTRRRRLRIAGLAAAESAAFLENGGPAAAMNGSVHAAAAQQGRIRRVHDRVDLLGRDVALSERDSFRSSHTITVPEADGQIVPMLSYEDVGRAADWLVNAFGFEEADRIEHEGETVHVELRLGAGAVMLGKPGATYINPKRLREQCEAAAEMYRFRG